MTPQPYCYLRHPLHAISRWPSLIQSSRLRISASSNNRITATTSAAGTTSNRIISTNSRIIPKNNYLSGMYFTPTTTTTPSPVLPVNLIISNIITGKLRYLTGTSSKGQTANFKTSTDNSSSSSSSSTTTTPGTSNNNNTNGMSSNGYSNSNDISNKTNRNSNRVFTETSTSNNSNSSKGNQSSSSSSSSSSLNNSFNHNQSKQPTDQDTQNTVSPTEDNNLQLVSLLAEKEAERAELHDRLLRALAENENLRTRYQKELESSRSYSISKFAESILNVADTLDMAIKQINEHIQCLESNINDNNNNNKTEKLRSPTEPLNSVEKSVLKGVEMTRGVLANVLAQYGVSSFDPLGDAFDPSQHDALFELSDTSKTKGTVIQVVKLGYRIKDRILRPAQVGTAK